MQVVYRVGLVLSAALLLAACGTLTNQPRVEELETQVAQQKATIVAMESTAVAITNYDQMATQNAQLQDQLTYIQATALAAQSALLAQGGGGVGSQPQIPAAGQPDVSGSVPAQMTPNTSSGLPEAGGGMPGLTPTPGGTQTSFSQTTTATAILEADGCPADRTAIFDTTEDEIFVVTRITNLRAGSSFSARWMANGALFSEMVCWTPQEDWDSVCAYCSITPSDGGGDTFEPGSWSVELMLDNQLMSQAQFQVVEAATDTGTGETTE